MSDRFFVAPNRVTCGAAVGRVQNALTGGLIGGVSLDLGKRGFAAYLLKIPTYKAVDEAFAVFPLFLMWVVSHVW